MAVNMCDTICSYFNAARQRCSNAIYLGLVYLDQRVRRYDSVQFHCISTVTTVSTVSTVSVDSTVTNLETNWAVKHKVIKKFPTLTKMLEDKYNQKFIAMQGFDDYGIGTVKQWKKANDLKGVKVIAAGPNLPWVSLFGAIPVTSTLPTMPPKCLVANLRSSAAVSISFD